VPDVDVAAGTVTVTPPAGLFEELPGDGDDREPSTSDEDDDDADAAAADSEV
jgi:16S rRNA processing protein RimM